MLPSTKSRKDTFFGILVAWNCVPCTVFPLRLEEHVSEDLWVRYGREIKYGKSGR